MNPLKFLSEFWAGIKEQVALIAFTQAVWMLSKLTKPKLAEWTTHLNKSTDRKFGSRADVVQRAVAENLEIVVQGLQA